MTPYGPQQYPLIKTTPVMVVQVEYGVKTPRGGLQVRTWTTGATVAEAVNKFLRERRAKPRLTEADLTVTELTGRFRRPLNVPVAPHEVEGGEPTLSQARLPVFRGET